MNMFQSLCSQSSSPAKEADHPEAVERRDLHPLRLDPTTPTHFEWRHLSDVPILLGAASILNYQLSLETLAQRRLYPPPTYLICERLHSAFNSRSTSLLLDLYTYRPASPYLTPPQWSSSFFSPELLLYYRTASFLCNRTEIQHSIINS